MNWNLINQTRIKAYLHLELLLCEISHPVITNYSSLQKYNLLKTPRLRHMTLYKPTSQMGLAGIKSKRVNVLYHTT